MAMIFGPWHVPHAGPHQMGLGLGLGMGNGFSKRSWNHQTVSASSREIHGLNGRVDQRSTWLFNVFIPTASQKHCRPYRHAVEIFLTKFLTAISRAILQKSRIMPWAAHWQGLGEVRKGHGLRIYHKKENQVAEKLFLTSQCM